MINIQKIAFFMLAFACLNAQAVEWPDVSSWGAKATQLWEDAKAKALEIQKDASDYANSVLEEAKELRGKALRSDQYKEAMAKLTALQKQASNTLDTSSKLIESLAYKLDLPAAANKTSETIAAAFQAATNLPKRIGSIASDAAGAYITSNTVSELINQALDRFRSAEPNEITQAEAATIIADAQEGLQAAKKEIREAQEFVAQQQAPILP